MLLFVVEDTVGTERRGSEEVRGGWEEGVPSEEGEIRDIAATLSSSASIAVISRNG